MGARHIWFIVVVAIAGWFGLPTSAHMQDGGGKSGVAPQVINLPSGPGSIQGLGESFQPNLNTGMAAYRIPLELPPGRAGHAPMLALIYDGGHGNSPFGLGWQLTIPWIQRQTDKGLPSYTDDDLFVHQSGEELVPLADGSYRFKVEGRFTRFRRQGVGWEGVERDGVRWLFGETAAGRQTNDYGVFCWLPQRAIDTNGNEIRFFYEQDGGQVYLKEIRYNFHPQTPYGAEPEGSYVSIRIDYESRSDLITDYRSRTRVLTAWRASRISVWAHDGLVRRYELSYDDSDGLSLLSQVRVLGRDLVRWEDDPTRGIPPVILSYTDFDPARSETISMSQPPLLSLDDGNADLVDINGDALPDLLHTPANGGQRFYLNQGRGRWTAEPLFPEQSPPNRLETSGVQLADMNGDGLVDLLVKAGSSPVAPFYYYPNHGGSAWELMERIDFSTSPPFSFEDPDVRLVDLDHDRRIDILRTTAFALEIYFNHPEGWSQAPDRSLEPLSFGNIMRFSDPRLRLADMNGDRLQDVVFVNDRQVVYFAGMGMGDFDAPVVMVGSPDFNDKPADAMLADIDGDGLTDLLMVDRFSVRLWLNQAAVGYADPLVFTDVPERIISRTVLRLADMNGDGGIDLLYSNWPADEDKIWQILDFRGATPPHLLERIENGLGRRIVLSYSNSTSYYVDDEDAGRPWTLTSPLAVTVVSRSTVEDAHSGQTYATDYSYRNAYYDGLDKAFRGFALAQQLDRGDATAPSVVKRVIFDTGATDESRKGLILQQDILSEDGSCGPDTEQAALSAATVIGVMPPARALANAFSTVLEDNPFGGCYSRTINQIETRTIATATDMRQARFSFIAQTDMLVHETTSAPRRTRQNYGYDVHGNMITHFEYGEVSVDGTQVELGNDERLTFREYAVNTTAWILNRPSRIHTTDLAGQFVSEQRIYYDGLPFVGLRLGQVSAGNPVRIEGNLGPESGSHWVQSRRRKFDEFGNIVAMIDPEGQLNQFGEPADVGHWSQIRYDATYHTYPISEITHIGSGHSLSYSAEYDLGLGVIIRATDYNGNVTTFDYDGLARLTTVVRPGDTVHLPTTMYTYTVGNPLSSILTSSREQFGEVGQYHTMTYFDGLGRAVQTRSDAEDGKVAVSASVRFNLRGKAFEQAMPYFEAGRSYKPIPGDAAITRTTYDALLRPLVTTNPDASFTKMVYRPLVEEVYDEEDTSSSSDHFNTPTRYVFDGLGRQVVTLERDDEDLYETTFTYDLLDNLIQVIDSQGNIKIQSFDALSRKTRLTDPDIGTINYVYDDAGNVLERHDAKGQRIISTYDGANRLVSQNLVATAQDQISDIIYHYDDDLSPDYPDASNTLGQVAWIEDGSGAEFRSYDARGNLSGRIKRLTFAEGTAFDFVSLMSYDSLDRLATMTYADGFSLRYGYNEQSLLQTVSGYLEEMNYAASGQPISMVTTDGVKTTYQYDSRLRLTGLKVINGSSEVLNDWRYYLDRVDHILKVQDQLGDAEEMNDTRELVFDDLYRLTSVHYTNGQKEMIEYEYDSIGNMIRQTANFTGANLGNLTYGKNAGPHALTQQGSNSWSYDANGNVTARDGFTYDWDVRDLLVEVRGPDGLVQENEFDYSSTRVRKIVNAQGEAKTVLYPDRHLEVRNEQLVKYIFAGELRLAEIRTPFSRGRLLSGFAGEIPQLYRFDTDGDGNVTAQEVQERGQFLDKVEFDEADDALTLFFDNAEQGDVPLDFGTIATVIEKYLVDPPPEPEHRILFYHGDHLGSAAVLTNPEGHLVERISYYPFGQERYHGDTRVAYRFTDQERDTETGLYDFGARFYVPITARFISADQKYTEEPEQALENPQLLNVYAYALNSPLQFVDPDGRKPKQEWVIQKANVAETYRGKVVRVVPVDIVLSASIFNYSRSFWTAEGASRLGNHFDSVATLYMVGNDKNGQSYYRELARGVEVTFKPLETQPQRTGQSRKYISQPGERRSAGVCLGNMCAIAYRVIGYKEIKAERYRVYGILEVKLPEKHGGATFTFGSPDNPVPYEFEFGDEKRKSTGLKLEPGVGIQVGGWDPTSSDPTHIVTPSGIHEAEVYKFEE